MVLALAPGVSRATLLVAGIVLGLPLAVSAQQVAGTSPHGPLAEACSVCHSPEAWSPARIDRSFDHRKAARFPLIGAHVTASCRACHVSLDFQGTPRGCASCHTDPHRGEVGNDCARCHSTRSFLDRAGMTGAHQLTRFPLTGTHLTIDCEACHVAPRGRLVFVAISGECSSCHLRDYQGTQDPNHGTAGFSTDCVQCHATVSWLRTRFDHASTGFALTGAHLRIFCSQCHGVGQFQALPSACVSCHQADYSRTTDPNHQAAQFPTDCAACHTTNTWRGARFDHDGLFFPIFSGAHQGRWSSCSDCHTNPNDFRQFNCLSCHGNAHPGRNYTSQQCYSCHPQGTGGGG